MRDLKSKKLKTSQNVQLQVWKFQWLTMEVKQGAGFEKQNSFRLQQTGYVKWTSPEKTTNLILGVFEYGRMATVEVLRMNFL